MNQVMYSVDEVKAKISQGKALVLAGDEAVIKQLPSGQWIAGTIPYFMTENGGAFAQDKIYVTELPAYVTGVALKTYDEQSIVNLYRDGYENGFSIMIIPASSPTHLTFALKAPQFDGFATHPVIGWISGVDLSKLGQLKPKVIAGDKNTLIENGAVVMHISLPKNKYAEINIINIFKQGNGATITFPEDGFSVKEAEINGEKKNFAEYLTVNKIDTRLPLVADYCGAMINISFQTVDQDNKVVNLYAPVFKGVEYKLAAPVADYVSSFCQQIPSGSADKIFFSCNCILNYLYSELEGKQTGGITGPITFGEIAYQLLNQTLAYVVIGDL